MPFKSPPHRAVLKRGGLLLRGGWVQGWGGGGVVWGPPPTPSPTGAEFMISRFSGAPPPHRYGKQLRVHNWHCSKQSRDAKQKSKNKALQ